MWFCLHFCVVFDLFRLFPSLCLVLPVSLDCPFLIAASVFSGAYIGMKINNPYILPDLSFTVLGEVYSI